MISRVGVIFFFILWPIGGRNKRNPFCGMRNILGGQRRGFGHPASLPRYWPVEGQQAGGHSEHSSQGLQDFFTGSTAAMVAVAKPTAAHSASSFFVIVFTSFRTIKGDSSYSTLVASIVDDVT